MTHLTARRVRRVSVSPSQCHSMKIAGVPAIVLVIMTGKVSVSPTVAGSGRRGLTSPCMSSRSATIPVTTTVRRPSFLNSQTEPETNSGELQGGGSSSNISLRSLRVARISARAPKITPATPKISPPIPKIHASMRVRVSGGERA